MQAARDHEQHLNARQERLSHWCVTLPPMPLNQSLLT